MNKLFDFGVSGSLDVDVPNFYIKIWRFTFKISIDFDKRSF